MDNNTNQQVQAQGATRGNEPLGVAAMIVGIVAIAGAWVPLLNFFSIILAVVGLGLAIAGLVSVKKKNRAKGTSIAGLVLSLAAILCFILVYVGASKAVDKMEAESKAEYSVSITDKQIVKDNEDRDAILVKIDFTNNSKKEASFVWSVGVTAFQDGIELDTASALEGGNILNPGFGENNTKDIKPGTTVECEELFVLRNLSSDVELKATKGLLGSTELATKTFKIR